MENCVHTNLPGSHEPTDLLQVSLSYDVLEDDIIGEVHTSLCRGHRNDRCRVFPRLCAMWWTVAWPSAVWRDVRWCSTVSGCVVRRTVVCCAELCGGVLGCRCVVCGGVMGGRRVLWAARVRWHRYMVVVLHPCNGSASPSPASPGRGKLEIQEKIKILGSVSFLSRLCLCLILLLSCHSSSCCYCITHALHKFLSCPSPSFIVPSSFSYSRLNWMLLCLLCLLVRLGGDPFIPSVGLFWGLISSDSSPSLVPPTVVTPMS